MKKTEPKENLKKILKEQRGEYQRYLGAAMEHFESEVGAIAEQYGNIIFKIEVINENIEFIKNSLKIKVDLEEFSALERRVTLLEKRSRLLTA